MRPLSAMLLTSAAALTACSTDPQLDGSYINSDDSNAALMLQITAVDDKDVHGTLSLVGTDEKGQIVARRLPIAGTLEGRALNLTIENGTGGMASGKVVPDGLQLTLLGNGQSLRLAFRRADAAEFDKIVSDVRMRSAQARHESARAAIEVENAKNSVQVQRRIGSLADRLSSDARAVSAKMRDIDKVIAGYPQFAARADQLRTAAKQLDSRTDEGSYRISDIRYRLSANRDIVEQAHSNVRDLQRAVEEQRKAHLGEFHQLMAECRADPRLECNRVASAMADYNASISALHAAAARESSAFEAERSRF